MTILSIAVVLLAWLLRIYTWVLWARFILELVRVFKPNFRPRGFWVVPVELVFTLTDPPIKMFRRILPPIRLGQIAIDLGWMLTMFSCWILLALLPLIPV
ncbi:MAG: YggT family protein [Leucobacter sp.]